MSNRFLKNLVIRAKIRHVFAGAGNAMTTVTLNSGDATIKANYATPGDVYE